MQLKQRKCPMTNLELVRRIRGISQAELSNLSGVQTSTISRAEALGAQVSDDSLAKLAYALNYAGDPARLTAPINEEVANLAAL